MKKIIYICYLPLIFLFTGCKKEAVIESKAGVSLPVVTNLKLQKTTGNEVKLTWGIPSSISDQIVQPLSVFIEVSEVISVTKTVSVFSTTLANAATEFVYQLPDAAKTYHLTVKLLGNTKVVDKNYSSRIYSLGQTVVYTK
nr:DUF4945 domain-containing protein [Pedobacter panaciterrae]